MIAGVASGIAAYLGIEPWIVRIGFRRHGPLRGLRVLAYLIAWLLVPIEGSGQSLAGDVLRRPPSGIRSYIGVALILLAVAILASAFSEPGVIWAIVLIAFGIFLFRQDDPEPPDRRPPGGGRRAAAGGGGAPGPADTTTPLPPAALATTTTEPLGPPPVSGQGTATLPADVPVWTPPPPPPDRTAAWGPPPQKRPRRRPFLGPLTFAVALIATGLALVLDNLDVIDLSFGQVLAVFLTVLGAACWSAPGGGGPGADPGRPAGRARGRPDRPGRPRAGRGRDLRAPVPAHHTGRGPPTYRLAGGELILDLSKVDFGPGAPPVEASVAGGRVLVVIPDEAAADVRGRVGVGSVDLLGHVESGAQLDSTVTEPASKPPAKGAAPTVKLDLMAGYGVIEVRRASDPGPSRRPARSRTPSASGPPPRPPPHERPAMRRHELDPISSPSASPSPPSASCSSSARPTRPSASTGSGPPPPRPRRRHPPRHRPRPPQDPRSRGRARGRPRA